MVAAPVAGRLDRLGLQVGDPVQANQAIAPIDPCPLASQVQSLPAQIRALAIDALKNDALKKIIAKIIAPLGLSPGLG